MESTIKIKDGAKAELKGSRLILTKGSATVEREFHHPLISIKVEGDKLVFKSKKENRTMKALINTFTSHVNNMMAGIEKPYTYKMKICSSHFPMSVKVEGNKVIINNFVGEKVPRSARIVGDAKVEIGKDGIITITSRNIEDAGLTAGALENATRITTRDRRIVQDGIFITEKPE